MHMIFVDISIPRSFEFFATLSTREFPLEVDSPVFLNTMFVPKLFVTHIAKI